MIFFKKYTAWMAVGLLGVMTFTACSDDDSYAERRDRERSQISSFVKTEPARLVRMATPYYMLRRLR